MCTLKRWICLGIDYAAVELPGRNRYPIFRRDFLVSFAIRVYGGNEKWPADHEPDKWHEDYQFEWTVAAHDSTAVESP